VRLFREAANCSERRACVRTTIVRAIVRYQLPPTRFAVVDEADQCLDTTGVSPYGLKGEYSTKGIDRAGNGMSSHRAMETATIRGAPLVLISCVES